MPFCKNCGQPFEWGFDQNHGRWIPLEPRDTDRDLDKTFVDEHGNLRADHRDRCRGETVNVTRLTKKVPAENELVLHDSSFSERQDNTAT